MKKKINDLLLAMQSGENCIGDTANELHALMKKYSKKKLENEKDSIREWLIGEDFELLAEKI